MAAIDLGIEVDPVRTLLVLGPQITALCMSEGKDNVSSHPSFLEYRKIVEGGIKRSLELENFSSNEAKKRKEMLLLNAYELEPAFAAYKVLEALKQHNEYDSWMTETFCHSKDYNFDGTSSPTLQYILSLRREGVRLIYTHYDDLLARALGLPVVLMEDEEGARKWSQGFPALLHLHGIFSRPQSMKIDCLCYNSIVGGGKTADIVREQFQSRAVLFLGFDEPFVDPFLPKVLSTFATPFTMPTSFPLLLTSLHTPPVTQGCLTLKVENYDLKSVVKVASTSLGVAPMNDTSHPVSIRLMCTDKQTMLNIIDNLRHIPNIMARSSDDDQCLLNLQMSRPSLHRTWSEVFVPVMLSQLSRLNALQLEGSFIVQLRKPQVEKTVLCQPLTQPTIIGGLSPTSMSTSLWKQVNPSSIPPVSTLSSIPHFTLPTTFLPGNLNAQQQLRHISQISKAGQLQTVHEKVRRIQSENDGLSLRDRMELKNSKHKKNGLLIHQQSAPIIQDPYMTSQGGRILPGSGTVGPSIFAVPGPSLMMNLDRKHSEHKIECIEQKERKEQHLERESHDKPKRKHEGKQFENKKLKFIQEAKEWSKNIEHKLTKEEETNDFEHQAILVKQQTPHPLIPLHQAGSLFSLPLQPSNTTPTSPQSANQSPKLVNHKQPQTYLMGSPQTCGMYTIIPPNPTIPTMAPTLSQVPLLTAMQSISSNQSPSDTHILPAGLIPRTLPLATPTLNPDQKFVYMMHDGTLIATPLMQGGQLGFQSITKEDSGTTKPETHSRSPKRIRSPNSDLDISNRPMPKRRRSSSLPDVSNLKSPSPEEDSPTSSPHPPPPLPPPPPPHSTFFQMSSPTAMKVETPTGFLTLPQITSPSTGHYNPSLFFSGMHLSSTITSSPNHHNGIQQGDSHKEGDNPSTYPPSPPDDNPLHPVPIGRGPIQLWQFLLDLLLCADKNHMIQWTGNGYEFRILQPEEIAKLWGARKNKPRMNYDKLSRGLRYYYSKGIMDKVPGKKLTFKYTCNIQQYMTQRGASSNSTTTTVSFAN